MYVLVPASAESRDPTLVALQGLSFESGDEDTVLSAAIMSKEVAMIKEVLRTLTSEQVKHRLKTESPSTRVHPEFPQ